MLVSFEVETANGFDVRSVYQAYEQGRGADYSFVVYPIRAHDTPDWERIELVARELGVGLYEFRKPGLWSSWDQVLRARFRAPTSDDRSLFVRDALGGALDWPAAAPDGPS